MATTEVTLVIYDPQGRPLSYWADLVERCDAEVVESDMEEVE